MTYEKPIIKWIGGKTQIIDTIIDNIPPVINNYHELFIGGGSVLFAVLQQINITGSVNAYDINETLIHMYKNIQTKPQEIMSEITKIINSYNELNGTIINKKPKNLPEGTTSKESYFYWIRHQFNKCTQQQKNTQLGTAYFIFLNKTCFRGMYREGPRGFNVPYGHYTNPQVIDETHLNNVSKLIKNVNFYCQSFKDAFKNIKKRDFVYLDPPYVKENATSFVGYTSDGFTLEQHILLFSMCKNFKFLMNNSNVDLVKNSFDDKKYTIQTILCKRSINSKNPSSKTYELLIKSL